MFNVKIHSVNLKESWDTVEALYEILHHFVLDLTRLLMLLLELTPTTDSSFLKIVLHTDLKIGLPLLLREFMLPLVL